MQCGITPPTLSRQIPCNIKLARALAGLGNLPGRLHPQQRIHPHPKGLFDPQRHIGGEAAVLVEQDRQRLAGYPQHARCGRDVSGLIPDAGPAPHGHGVD